MYGTAKDAVIAFFNNEMLMLIAFITTLTVVSIDKSLSKLQKKLTYVFVVLCMLYTLLVFLDYEIGTMPFDGNVTFRMVCCTTRLIIKPAPLMLVALGLSKTLSKNKLFYVPVGINTLLLLANIGTGICFTITPESDLVTKPLYFVCVAIFLLYVLILVIVYQTYPLIRTPKVRITSLIILVMIPLAELGEIVAERNVLGTAILIADIFEYVLLLVLRNNVRLKNKDESIAEQRNALAISQMASMSDEMTGTYNRRAYDAKMAQEADLKCPSADFTVVMCDINGLKEVNDTYGHQAGDKLIKDAAECLKASFSEYGTVYRIGGDEFAALVVCSEKQLLAAIKRLDYLCSTWKECVDEGLSISKGYARLAENGGRDIQKLVKTADQRMYDDKDEYYKMNPDKERRRQK